MEKADIRRRYISKSFCFALLAACTLSLTAAEDEAAVEVQQKVPEVPLEPKQLRNDRIIATQLKDGEAKWLKAGGVEFLGIFNADSSGKALGSVLIIPEPGNAVNIHGAIDHLSLNLATAGWHTLARSSPELSFAAPSPNFPNEPKAETSDAVVEEGETAEETEVAETTETTEVTEADESQLEIPDATKWYADQQTKNMEKLLLRILAAEAELNAYGGKYVILAQGVSAELILELISSKVIKPAGLITLDVQHPVNLRSSQIPKNMALIQIPMLDVFHKLDSTQSHKRKLKNKSVNYRQLYVPAQENNFRGSESLLYRRIKGWLKLNFSK